MQQGHASTRMPNGSMAMAMHQQQQQQHHIILKHGGHETIQKPPTDQIRRRRSDGFREFREIIGPCVRGYERLWRQETAGKKKKKKEDEITTTTTTKERTNEGLLVCEHWLLLMLLLLRTLRLQWEESVAGGLVVYALTFRNQRRRSGIEWSGV